MRLVKYAIPAISLVLAAYTTNHILSCHSATSPPSHTTADVTPKGTITALGHVKPHNEVIRVGTPMAGLVEEVYVTEGDALRAGDRLFRLDDWDLQGEARVREAELLLAEAELARLRRQPRPESLPPAEAQIDQAEAALASASDRLGRTERLFAESAASEEVLTRTRQAVKAAESHVRRTKAEYDLLAAGAWIADIAVAEAKAASAQAAIQQVQLHIDRRTVRAPSAGAVLHVDVHPGEFVALETSRDLLLLGDMSEIHVVAELDEHDVARFDPSSAALATIRGEVGQKIAIAFVRLEPRMMPKTEIRGDYREWIDTRVLKVVYKVVDAGDLELIAGQQVDVFIESP